ncbi:cytochrome c oxidase assembly protein [Pseudotabrizicola sp. 4114]|uniref:cytochrome c oxidase assembly protein n=1 Tax=Pseudotabrizicola sp. 4114 TaxID=2817731 RepID=UPI00285F7342|nr:putative membrane protein [Pseudorhodobacter sp. 4114]
MGVDAVPYCGPLIAPESLIYAWNGDPWLLLMLACGGVAVLWHRSRTAMSAGQDRALLLAGIGLVVAFVSPLCAATVALFSARVLHHVVLVSVVAPALAVALPWRALPAAVAMGLTSVALILWHVPAVYDAAWTSVTAYWAMQGALLLPAWLFWSAVLHTDQRAEGLFAHALGIGGLAAVMGFIGAVLTFAPTGLYPQHLVGAEAFGMTLLSDQQLAGLIMWVPGFLPLAGIAFWMVRRGWKQGFTA